MRDSVDQNRISSAVYEKILFELVSLFFMNDRCSGVNPNSCGCIVAEIGKYPTCIVLFSYIAYDSADDSSTLSAGDTNTYNSACSRILNYYKSL